MISELYPPYGGGGEIAAYLHCRYLAEEGIKVDLVTNKFEGDKTTELVEQNYRIWRIPLVSQKVNNLPFATYLKSRLCLLDVKKIAQIVKKTSSDVVHIENADIGLSEIGNLVRVPVVASVFDHWPFCARRVNDDTSNCDTCRANDVLNCVVKHDLYPALLGKLGEEKHSIKQSLYYSALLFPHTYLLYRSLGRKKRQIMDNVDKLIPESKYIHDLLRSELGIEETKISVVYPLFPQYRYSPMENKNKELRFAFIGRLHSLKGIVNLLEAFAEALERNKRICLRVFGDGPLKNHVLKYIHSSSQLEQHIYYCGTFKPDSFANVMKDIDVVVIPSLAPEAFGRVCAEAMLNGRPVIINPTGGLAEQVQENVTGFYADCYSVDNLAVKICEVANHSREYLNSIGIKGRISAIKKYDNKVNVRKLIHIYENVTARANISKLSPRY